MNDITPYLHLFKGEWISDPQRFRDDLRKARANDFPL